MNIAAEEGLQALSPPTFGGYHSSVTPPHTGEEQDACSTKTFHSLVSCLNASFKPDYDFSHAKSEEFSRIPNLNMVSQDIHNILKTSLGDSYSDIKEHMWNTIDREIQLAECSFYSYNADLDSDPYAESLWYFNYFFYNKKMKRILFFSCQAHPYVQDSEDEMFWWPSIQCLLQREENIKNVLKRFNISIYSYDYSSIPIYSYGHSLKKDNETLKQGLLKLSSLKRAILYHYITSLSLFYNYYYIPQFSLKNRQSGFKHPFPPSHITYKITPAIT